MAYDARQPVAPTNSGARRVVVTGAGIVTALGCHWETNAAGFRQGRSALKEITLFDTSGQRTHRGGEARLPEQVDPRRLTPRQAKRLDRASKLLLLAGCEAWDQAGWGENERQLAPPMVIGTSAGGMSLGEDYYRQAHERNGPLHGQATRVALYQPQCQVMGLANALGVGGPITIVSNACASGADAIGQAYWMIRHGRAACAIAGGYDALCQLVFAGFDALQALSPTLPRPFDADRDGLALGEGAAILMLEDAARARARGATVLGEICGYGCSTDVHHLTQPHPQGLAALASMTAACREAGVRPTEIDYINAHGTGTLRNDVAEGTAIQQWAGDDVGQIAVSSTKGAIGHLLGGAGAVEAVVALMTLQGQWLPPSLHVRRPDSVCTFDLVRSPRDTPVERVLTNSFGFGGSNASLVLGRAS